MRPTVLLFDIDGTLLDSRGAGRRAMEAAFEATIGTTRPLSTFTFHGMTDRAIVRQGLRAVDAPAGDEETMIERILEAYLEALPECIASAKGYRLHAGVVELLDALAGHEHFAIGLGTGNLHNGAHLKLSPLGIWDRFAFGGFGSDHEDRARLIAIGADRGAARLGQSREACRVVIIGDTPRDVEAALAIGAETLAVGTSGFDLVELRECGARHCVDDLTAPEALAMLLDD